MNLEGRGLNFERCLVHGTSMVRRRAELQELFDSQEFPELYTLQIIECIHNPGYFCLRTRDPYYGPVNGWPLPDRAIWSSKLQANVVTHWGHWHLASTFDEHGHTEHEEPAPGDWPF